MRFLLLFSLSIILNSNVAFAQPIDLSRTQVRAQLIPRKVTIISSELSARIKDMDLHKGDEFKFGDALVAFDCAVETAQRQRAQAKLEMDKKTVAVNERLAELHSISILEVERSLAEVKISQADLAIMNAVLDKCIILAPFSGKVVNLYARQYQYVQAGSQLLEIIDVSDLEVEVIVPSRWLVWLKLGEPFTIVIDETGKEYSAVIARLGATIDPVSQTLEIMGKIESNSDRLLSGMSGIAQFSPPSH